MPKIEISGESDIYVKTGSTVSLKCVITQSLEEPAYIFWHHDGERVLNYDRSAIDIRTDRVGTDTTVSTLIIFHARTEDSGNYTCSPPSLGSASVLLHVLNGKSALPLLDTLSPVIPARCFTSPSHMLYCDLHPINKHFSTTIHLFKRNFYSEPFI